MICSECGYMMDAFDKICPRCQNVGPQNDSNQSVPIVGPSQNTVIPDELNFNITSVAEAKLAIKELKLKKKEYQLKKKDVTAAMAQIRAEHRSAKTQRGPAVRGRGGLMRTIRAVDSFTRHSQAVQVDNAIRELEDAKNVVDYDIAQFDTAILQLERYILENS